MLTKHPALSFIALTFVPLMCRASNDSLPLIAANDNRTAAGTLDKGVLTLQLEVREGQWHPGPLEGPPISPQIPVAIDTAAFG